MIYKIPIIDGSDYPALPICIFLFLKKDIDLGKVRKHLEIACVIYDRCSV